MTKKEENKRIRYFRVKKMYLHLKEYPLSSTFITEVIGDFFNIETPTIWRIIGEELEANVSYQYLHLDEIWIDKLVKELLTKKTTRKANGTKQNHQTSLQL